MAIRLNDLPDRIRQAIGRQLAARPAKTKAATEPAHILVTLPLPERNLHPNARIHHHAKAKITKQARLRAMLAATEATGGNKWRWKTAMAEYRFHLPDKRRHDLDGLLSACKAYQDGIVDAGVLEDDHGIEEIRLTRCIDKQNPRVTIMVKKLK